MPTTLRDNSLKLFLLISAVGGATTGGLAQPSGGNKNDALQRYLALNPHLSPDDPRQLSMKLWTITRDEEAFFRGTADLFYAYCKESTPDLLGAKFEPVLLHGDIHIGNIGAYQSDGAIGEDIHFGLVDLDETFRGPFTLDLLRAVTALRVAVTAQTSEPISDGTASRGVRALCRGYREALGGKISEERMVEKHRAARQAVKQARKGDPKSYLAEYTAKNNPLRFLPTRMDDGAAKDLMDPVSPELRAKIESAVWDYVKEGCMPPWDARFRYRSEAELKADLVDVVHWTRMGSAGSQGVAKYLFVLKQPLKDHPHPVIFQLKEEPIPAAGRAGLVNADARPARAREVARAYKRTAASAEWLVGHTQIDGRGYLVRAKDPFNEELEIKSLLKKAKDRDIADAAELMGEVIGLAHRTGLMEGGSADAAIERILDSLAHIEDELTTRSEAMENHLRAEFRSLRDDPRVKARVDQAESHIAKIVTGK